LWNVACTGKLWRLLDCVLVKHVVIGLLL
jgi:hypothetical protein